MSGTADQIEFKLGLLGSVVAFLLTMTADLVAVYLPLRSFKVFRVWYIDRVAADDWKKVLFPGVRISILHATRPAWFPFFRRFHWIWCTGFEPGNHHGGGVLLWSWQGVSGQSYCSEQSRFVRLDPPQNGVAEKARWMLRMIRFFRLSPLQAWRLRQVRAVLSVPLIVDIGRNRCRAIGVLNLDTTDIAAAQFLDDEKTELFRIFLTDGATIARML